MQNKRKLIALVVLFLVTSVGFGYGCNIFQENSEEASAMVNSQIDLCVKFDLQYETVTESNGKTNIAIISEGKNTAMRIHNYNTWVEMKTDEAESYPEDEKIQNDLEIIRKIGQDGTGKITFEDLCDKSNNFKMIWSSNGPMDRVDANIIFQKNNYLRIMNRVDGYGNPVDREGNPIFYDENGNQVDKDGNLIAEPRQAAKILVPQREYE